MYFDENHKYSNDIFVLMSSQWTTFKSVPKIKNVLIWMKKIKTGFQTTDPRTKGVYSSNVPCLRSATDEVIPADFWFRENPLI